MSARKRLKIEVFGRVQGVAFRWHTRREALSLGLAGTVRNRLDGSVLIYVEGARDRLEVFLEWARRGPSHARVDSVEHLWSEALDEDVDFVIIG